MDEYTLMVEKLGRYRRNLAQMTPEQKRQFKPALDKLRGEIHSHAQRVMAEALLGGLRFARDDCAEPMRRVAAILRDSDVQNAMKRAEDVLFLRPEGGQFLTELVPARYRILYEGYGAYWAAHCRPVSDSDEQTAFTFCNDLVGMYWSPSWRVWKTKGEWELALMLPPTMEQIEDEYRRNLAELREGSADEENKS